MGRKRTWPRLLCLAIWLLIAMAPVGSAAAADVNWSGSWATKWRDGGARLELQQSGDRVTGTYPLYAGEVVGRATGFTLEGRWTEGNRSGSFIFTMSPDQQSFVGRYGSGEWWTGGRTSGAAPAASVNRSSVREAIRTFVKAGNLAKAGLDEHVGAAVAVLDFRNRAESEPQGQKVRLARDLFDLISLTTFQIWELPGEQLEADRFFAKLYQAGTGVVLPLDLVRDARGQWSILVPDDATLASARAALLARYGGRQPDPSAYLKLRTARDAMTAFQSAFATWDGEGRARVLETLDSSQLFAATRTYEADLAAQYLKAILDRVSSVEPQEIPDDPEDRQPFVVFSHPSGNVVIAPIEGPDKSIAWRFTAETLRTARMLYGAVEAMPPVDPAALEGPHSTFFARRSWVRSWAPSLMEPVGPVERWQIMAGLIGVLACLAVAAVLTTILLSALRWWGGKKAVAAEGALGWPISIAIAASLFKLLIPFFGWPEEVRQFTAPVHALIIGIFGAWAGWHIINILAVGLMKEARRTASTLDDMTITLLAGAVRIGIIVAAASYVATQFAIPTNGILAGLGLGGLAVAIASKETLANLFGAGILVADRPFKKGDLITAGDIKGHVEHVGVRSTRIRTAEDTQVVIPNGKLTDASINNWGRRIDRVFETKIRIAYGATASEIDGFLGDLRRIFAEDEDVEPNRSDIGVTLLSDTAIIVEVTAYFRPDAVSTERAIKNRLMLAVMRAAERRGIVIGGTPGRAVASELVN